MTSTTIYALSSGAGRTGVAVLRVSGPQTQSILTKLTGSVPAPRRACLRIVRSTSDGIEIDRGLVIYFPGPESFTGEDVAEFQMHGSPAVVRRMLEELGQHPETELAQPGAFTERAFVNGKLDLTEVEGLADLIEADTELQRSQALAQSSGVLRQRSAQWRSSLIRALALIEAVLDFSDEGDVTEGPLSEAWQISRDLAKELRQAIAGTARADTIRQGLTIALVGAPNAGKSSLINALAARDVAIVTPEAGTTRDLIEVQLELAGLPVTFIDTAGIRDTDNLIEREGISRARTAATQADLVLHLVDASNPVLIEFEAADHWSVLTKADLPLRCSVLLENPIVLSAETGAGMKEFIERLKLWCQSQVGLSEPAIVTRQRQRICLERCLSALLQFDAGSKEDLELRAEDLRTAAVSLGRLTGEIDAEEVLDDLFAGFCIGK